MTTLQPVRGTHDLLPEDMRRHRRVVETAREVAERFGYLEIETPIFEFSEVFKRTLGDTSDIVTKEMYSFTDRGGEGLTLRPEGTASVARALISGGLAQHLPLKFFYHGPMFRYERPQKGRLRQFHQIGIELLGVKEPAGDVEVIATGHGILSELGLSDRITLEINSLGDGESRQAYRTELVRYFGSHRDKLSQESRDRLERNPLRILDSKDEGDRRIVAEAPLFGDYLNEASRDFFAAVTRGLDALGIPYRVSPRLVRGLDYYCHTAFEFVTDTLGAQGTVMAGGRYDGLIETMGGPATPGVGWASGIERLAMMLAETPSARRPLAVVPVGDDAQAPALKLAHDLRKAGFAVELGYGGNMSKRLKRANRLNASVALLMGEDELKSGVVTLRDLDKGSQETVALDALKDRLAGYR
ncbi:histidine--tRNA ligase [Hypericibacter sp.]|uniref:histidine--tRNA ligase n=1 Tax=Hypericibacter sp. TaxID=2705401 RepID=UPI003D6CD1DF